MDNNKKFTCCFTGHRPQAFHWCNDPNGVAELSGRLSAAIDRAMALGYTRFITGNALGVDTWAALEVLKKRDEGAAITLEVALPFSGHNKNLTGSDTEVQAHIHKCADKVHAVADGESYKKAFLLRDRYMVDNSSRVIAVFEDDWGVYGGTYKTVRYAKAHGLDIDYVPFSDIRCGYEYCDDDIINEKHKPRGTFDVVVSKAYLEHILEFDTHGEHNLIKLIDGGVDSPEYRKLLTMVSLKYQRLGGFSYRYRDERCKNRWEWMSGKPPLSMYKKHFRRSCEAVWEMKLHLFGDTDGLTREQCAHAKAAYEKYAAIAHYVAPLLAHIADAYGADYYADIIDYIMRNDVPLAAANIGDHYVLGKVRGSDRRGSQLLLFDPWDMFD